MIRRNVRILPAVLLGQLCGVWAAIGTAKEPTRLPSVLQIRMQQPPPPRMPAESPPVAAPGQSPYLPQPESPQVSGPFGGPVPAETLVGYALANNPEIQAARYRACALGARVPQAVSLPDPTLAAIVFLESIQTAAGPQEVMLSLSQKFPWFGKRALRSQVAYHEAMAAYARLAAVELELTERVKRSYYDVYFFGRAIEVNRELEPRLKDVIEIVQTRYAHPGEGPRIGLESVYQAEIELSGLQVRLAELEQAKVEAGARLAGMLHLEPYAQIDTMAKLDRTQVTETARLLVELAESCQPELTARRREVSRDRASVALACRDYWPDATVSLNWYEIGPAGLSPIATGNDAYSLGVGVNLPLYRQRLDAAVREARYKTAQSTRQYAATRDQVRAEVRALYAQFQQHDRVMKILQSEILPNATKTLDLSLETYRVGKPEFQRMGNLEFQQLIDYYRALLRYRIDFHKHQAKREQAIASLERAVGCALAGGGEEDMNPPEPPSAAPLPR